MSVNSALSLFRAELGWPAEGNLPYSTTLYRQVRRWLLADGCPAGPELLDATANWIVTLTGQTPCHWDQVMFTAHAAATGKVY